jgi:hypothetical protein
VFVRDRQTATTERVSVATGGGEANDFSILRRCPTTGASSPSSRRRRTSWRRHERVRRHLPARPRERDDVAGERRLGVAEANAPSNFAAISRSGGFVVFESDASNLVFGDANAQTDVFAHDRDPSSFTSVCSPGASGVIACPCANPPSDPGGAATTPRERAERSSRRGPAYLSSPTASCSRRAARSRRRRASCCRDRDAAAAHRLRTGVRCVGGTLKRLFTKTASGGASPAPDWSVFDPTVSSRSAAKGDVILAGRAAGTSCTTANPIVLGGCPATSTFNATQTGRVTWWP